MSRFADHIFPSWSKRGPSGAGDQVVVIARLNATRQTGGDPGELVRNWPHPLGAPRRRPRRPVCRGASPDASFGFRPGRLCVDQRMGMVNEAPLPLWRSLWNHSGKRRRRCEQGVERSVDNPSSLRFNTHLTWDSRAHTPCIGTRLEHWLRVWILHSPTTNSLLTTRLPCSGI